MVAGIETLFVLTADGQVREVQPAKCSAKADTLDMIQQSLQAAGIPAEQVRKVEAWGKPQPEHMAEANRLGCRYAWVGCGTDGHGVGPMQDAYKAAGLKADSHLHPDCREPATC